MTILVLYSAPSPSDLASIPSEVTDLANNLDHARLVAVGDSEDAIYQAIDIVKGRGERIKGLWFAGHAGPDGVQLGDHFLDAEAIILYTQASGAEWVVFNTCYGDRLARLIRAEVDIATLGIAHSADGKVGDKDAGRLAGFLSRSLRRTDGNLEEAYKLAFPRGGGSYLFRPPMDGYSSGLHSMDGKQQDDLMRVIHGLELRLSVLETQVALKMDTVLSEIDGLRRMIANDQSRTSKPNWTSVAIVVSLAAAYLLVLVVLIFTYAGA